MQVAEISPSLLRKVLHKCLARSSLSSQEFAVCTDEPEKGWEIRAQSRAEVIGSWAEIHLRGLRGLQLMGVLDSPVVQDLQGKQPRGVTTASGKRCCF